MTWSCTRDHRTTPCGECDGGRQDQVRNVGVLGHPAAGVTSLTLAALDEADRIAYAGRVKHGPRRAPPCIWHPCKRPATRYIIGTNERRLEYEVPTCDEHADEVTDHLTRRKADDGPDD